MGRFLVHMHHGGDDRLRRLLALNESKGIFKELFDLTRLLALKELRAGSNQGFHHPDAVFPGTASGFDYLLFRLRPIGTAGLDQMEIQPAPAGVHIRVAGVLFLGTLVVSFNPTNLRPLILGEAQDESILCKER